MTIIANYKRRKEDVEEYFRLLCFLLSFETHRGRSIQNIDAGKSLIITQEMQCVAKAQSLILLYNLVESTVCDCLNAIYDAIKDESLIFGNVSDDIKNMWYASTFPHCSMKSTEYLWPKTKRLVKDERRSKSKLRVCA